MCSLLPPDELHNSTDYELEYDFGNCEKPQATEYMVNYEHDTVTMGISARFGFMSVFALLLAAAVAGNVATLYVARTRPNSVTYKCLLASLACSDLCNAFATGLSCIANLSTELMDWLLGEVLCALIPFLQNASSVVNSLTLTCVALDRYQAVMSVSPGGRWQPRRWACALVLIVVWSVSCGVAAPMYESYSVVPAYIVRCNATNHTEHCTRIDRCFTTTLPENGNYHIVIFTVIFLPLLCVFLVLHGVIARIVWLKRKPLAQPSTSSVGPAGFASYSPSLNGTKRTTVTGDSHTDNSRIQRHAACKTAKPCSVPQHRSAHRERNIRTFRRILIMMLAFFALRLPSWSSLVFYSNVFISQDERTFWHLRYAFHVLTMLSCTLNPLLYCFCDETLQCLLKSGRWVRRLGCSRQSFFSSNLTLQQRTPPAPHMVPRGPYSDPQKQDQGCESRAALAVPGPSHI